MSCRIDILKNEISDLLNEGMIVLGAWAHKYCPSSLPRKLTDKEAEFYSKVDINGRYQQWYSKSSALVKQLLPNRYPEFIDLYYNAGSSKKLTTDNFRIFNALQGTTLSRYRDGYEREMAGMASASRLVYVQYSILQAAEERLKCSLYEIQCIVQADLFDSEIDSARELNDKGFVRAAGAVSGVLLEKHLCTVLDAHNLKIAKQHPCINDYNQKLKDESIIDVSTWRFIQRLGDLRNMCDHAKGVDPTRSQVDELIDGTSRVLKTIS